MKVGIIGFPQSGKKTLFTLITKHKPTENEIASKRPIDGIAEIVDPRFEKLVDMYHPESEARARINIVLLPDLEKGFLNNADMVKALQDADVLLYVVRDFADDSVYHASGSVDASRDIDEINMEFTFSDMLFIEKRLERIEKNLKRSNDETIIREKELLKKMKTCLDTNMPLRTMEISEEEKKLISSYPFLTLKKVIIALNVSESGLKDKTLLEKLENTYKKQDILFMQVSAKVEAEIASFENAEERKTFLKEAGIDEPAVDILKRTCIKGLDLISFFGVGADEVKQWTVKKGSSAPQAAGAIHSDLEKGFIRAEVMKYEELMSAGSESKLRETGKFYLKGKDYTVEDGDILSIRFNV